MVVPASFIVAAVAALGFGAVTRMDATLALLESTRLVAFTVMTVSELTRGAWYKPVLEIDPADTDHLTAELGVFLTRAVNCTNCEEATVVVSGETVTMMGDLAACASDKPDASANAITAHTRAEYLLITRPSKEFSRKRPESETCTGYQSDEVRKHYWGPHSVDCLVE